MKITSPGEIPTRPAPPDYFTGTVWQDPLIQTPAPARLQVVKVSFDPGARTAWHTHPLGQTLLVISGLGRVQSEGGPIREIRPGDVVWIPPGEKHWHGAAPNSGMVHLAMQEMENGSAAVWMDKVTDAQYSAAPGWPGARDNQVVKGQAAEQHLCPAPLRTHSIGQVIVESSRAVI